MHNVIEQNRAGWVKGPKFPIAQKTKLSQDKIALAKIKELWGSGNRNREQIAKEIGYAKSTTSENIRAMIKRGDLNPGHWVDE